MDLENLPILDWNVALMLAGNKRDLAEDMLQLVMRDLKNEMTVIKKWHVEQNYRELIQTVHKLHGALCYTGLIRIKTIIKKLETDLKNNIMDNSSVLIDLLENEYNQLLKHYPSAIV